MITYAADFESFYDDECSIKVLGNRGYYAHERFDAYMISVVGDNGYRWCGHPKEFDWSLFAGNIVVSHNAAFDEGLYLYGVEVGWYPAVEYAHWYCSADLCAYFGIPRSLKGACKWLFGMEMSKTTRDNMKGKQWSLMTEEFQKEVTDYALLDGDLCLQVWQKLESNWSEQERKISLQHREMMRRGIPMDVDAVDAGIVQLKQAIFDAEAMIPWAGEAKLLSPKAFALECRKHGIEPPSSMAITSEECDDWLEQFGETLPFAAAVRNWRRINSLLKKLEAFSRSIENGLYYGGIMYAGAHTRRASGSGGNLNLQNLPKNEMFGIKVRNFIRARAGKKLVVVDLSQIEVRVVHWLAGDEKTMQLMREVPDIYEVFAIMFKRWEKGSGDLKKLNPALRNNMKTVGLGVQFGAGAAKVASVSGMTEKESASFISTYIRSMPLVPKLWKSLKASLSAACRDGILKLEFPSGNSLTYRDVKSAGKRNVTCTLVKNGQPMTARLWHGSLIENCLSGSSEVLTDRRGWVPMISVTSDELVWDGEEFVSHSGCHFMGVKPTIECHAVICTPDHKFLVGSEWVAAEKAGQLDASMVCLPHGVIKQSEGLHGNAVRVTSSSETAVCKKKECGVGSALRLRGNSLKDERGSSRLDFLQPPMPAIESEHIYKKDNAWEVEAQALCGMEVYERSMHAAVPSSMGELWRAGHSCMQSLAGVLPRLLGRRVSNMEGRLVSGPRRQQRGLQSGELPVGDLQPEQSKYARVCDTQLGIGRCRQERDWPEHAVLSSGARLESEGRVHDPAIIRQQVYDLFDCGPRNRFAVRGGRGKPVLIAHNCAQSLARDIFMDRVLAMEAEGWLPILHVHDEVVLEVDEEHAQECLDRVIEIMSTPPDFISSIPLGAEGSIMDFYDK